MHRQLKVAIMYALRPRGCAGDGRKRANVELALVKIEIRTKREKPRRIIVGL